MKINLLKSLMWFFRLPSSFFEKVFETKVLSIATAATFFILITLGVKLVETKDIAYVYGLFGALGAYFVLFVIVVSLHYRNYHNDSEDDYK